MLQILLSHLLCIDFNMLKFYWTPKFIFTTEVFSLLLYHFPF